MKNAPDKLQWHPAFCAAAGLEFHEDIERLEQALRYGTAHIQEAVAWSEYASRPYAVDYLTKNIDFVLDAPKRRAMELYWQLGRRYDPPSPSRPDSFSTTCCQPDTGDKRVLNEQ